MRQSFFADNGDCVYVEIPDKPVARVASPEAKAMSRAIGDYRREFFKAHRRAASSQEIAQFRRNRGKP